MGKISKADLSVIIITPDHYETIRKTVQHIRRQTAVSRIELIIVTPAKAALEADDAGLQDFFRCRIVEVESILSLGQAKAAGIREAGAPVIALIEEHVYPDPGWAEALLKAHEGAWAAVGPAVRNANPHSLTSWADFIITYGHWMEPLTAGAADILPGHNSSYKRDILLSYGESLAGMLEVEAILHLDLQRQGHQVCLEPGAIIYHLGFSRMLPSLPVQFHIGRLFAADRARQWSSFRRLLYTGGAPLIPLVRFSRLLHHVLRYRGQHAVPLRSLPLTFPGLAVSALGEMAGYAMGRGNSRERVLNYEFHRAQQ